MTCLLAEERIGFEVGMEETRWAPNDNDPSYASRCLLHV